MADGRLEKLADDLVAHWDDRLVLLMAAMIVAISRKAAVGLYDEIIKRRPEWHADDIDKGVIKVVMAPARHLTRPICASMPLRHKRRRCWRSASRIRMTLLFSHRARHVADRYFDAPCLHTLYVDKPMRGQGLMQAVARVNRVWKDKPGGLVVDYIGIGEELKAAIAQYTRARGHDHGEPVEFIDEALSILKETIGIIRDMLHGVDLTGVATDAKRALAALPLAMNHLVKLNQKKEGAKEDEKPEGVKRFLDQVVKLTKAQALAGTHPDALLLRNEIAFYQAVRAGLVKFTSVGAGKSKVEKEAAMRQIVGLRACL